MARKCAFAGHVVGLFYSVHKVGAHAVCFARKLKPGLCVAAADIAHVLVWTEKLCHARDAGGFGIR